MEAITLISIVLGIVIIVLMYNSTRRKSRYPAIYKLPRPPSLPFLGCALQLATDEETMSRRMLIEWPKLYGPRCIFHIPGREYFFSSKCGDIEKILSSTTQLKKGMEYEFVNPWLGNGLLTTSQVPKWSKHRKLLNPSFNNRILEQFVLVFNKQAKVMVEILEHDSQDGTVEVDICNYSNLCALDIICETAMGKSVNAQREKNSEYVDAINEVTRLIIRRSSRPWLHPALTWKISPSGRREKKCLEILHGFTDKVIKERKAEVLKLRSEDVVSAPENESDSIFMTRKKRTLAFMDLLLNLQADDPESISDADIRAETDTFMFAGHDTTAANLAWTIYLLGLYPEKQERVLQELFTVLGEDLTKEVTPADINQLKYLECCIKEALRMYPSVASITRKLSEDLVLDDGLIVPKGFNFILVPLSVHRDAVSFPSPDVYNPERFLPENSVGRHPYSYIPFSMGPRNCIGQKFALLEEKVVLAYFLRRFRVESVTKENSIILKHEIILRPKDGLRVKLHQRKVT